LKGRQHNGALYAVLRATKPDHCFSATDQR
jgi:hypothetical protein